MTKPSRTSRPPAPIILMHLRRGDLNFEIQNTEVLHGILNQAARFGWDVLNVEVCHNDCPAGLVPAGAILYDLPDSPLAIHLREMGVPVVRMGRFPHPQDKLMPPVLYDFTGAARLAAEHFCERGFKDIAFVGRDPWGNMRFLYEAFRDRALELGLTCHLIRIGQAGFEHSRGHGMIMERHERRAKQVGIELNQLPKPVGVLAFNDIMGGTLCLWTRMANLSIPEAVAVLGIGNERFYCEGSPVSLSSVDMNSGEYGRRAAGLLHRLMNGEPPPQSPLFIAPKGIEVRRSTDILAVDNPLVGKALRFMWDHLEQPLSVDTIAVETGVARRKLERAFKRSIGRTINVELRRKRLETARSLLRSTHMSVASIAETVGISSLSYFFKAFQGQYGLTPNQYRETLSPDRPENR